MNPLYAIWGPGPDAITFQSDHEGPMGIYVRRLDSGPGELETLWKAADGSYLGLGSWSRDGTAILFRGLDPQSRRQTCSRVRVSEGNGSLAFGRPEKLFEGSWLVSSPARLSDVAPDGRLLPSPLRPETWKDCWDRVSTGRIIVDTGGVAHLLAEAKGGR